MSSKNERLDITMRLLGAREVERESEKAGKGIKGVGTAASSSTGHHEKLHRATSTLTKSYSQLGKATRYGIGFLGAGGLFALKSSISGTEELAKTTSGLNRNMGLSVKTSSEWASLAHARGIETSTLTMGMTKLGKSFVEANRKGGTARTALNQLGISQTQTTKGAHDFNYAVDLVAGALGRAHGGAQRQTAALGLLGKGSRELIPIFSEGREGLEQQLHWADKYGSTLNGKSLEGVMAMVTAQREFKASMFGLQVQATTALLPAIHAVDDEVNTLASTLANPKLTEEQKFSRISRQFLNLENSLLGILEKALPKIAEKGGELGVRLAEAVWNGFENSNLTGKLVISAWLFKFMGGGGLIKSVSGKAGGAIARGLIAALLPRLAEEFAVTGSVGLMLKSRWANMGKWSGRAFDTGVVLGIVIGIPLLIQAVFSQLSKKTQESVYRWGINAGQNFVNALIFVINKGIGAINWALSKGNALAILGVEAPQLAEIGKVNAFEEGPIGGGPAPKPAPNAPGPTVNGPPGTHINPKTGKIEGPHKHHSSAAGRRDSRPLVIHVHSILDGKQVAESVISNALTAAAFR